MSAVDGSSGKLWLLAAALAVSFGMGTPAGAADDEPSMATPAGITLVKERSGGRRSAQNVFRLGDEHGMKVYARHDRTTICDQACMKGWRPLPVLKGAAPYGDWTIVTFDAGINQWAYKGEPLFTHEGDPPYEDLSEAADDARIAEDFADVVASVRASIRPKESDGTAAGQKGPQPQGGTSSPVDLQSWDLVVYEPEAITAPPGISVAQISNAFGEGFVDRRGMTIYLYRGKAPQTKRDGGCDGPCPQYWAAVAAPARAVRVGDFTVVAGKDGTSQWAFRGMPLYTSTKDIVPGHANAADAGPQWQIGLTARYFMPPAVSVQITPIAEVLSVDGRTLYTRNPFIYQLGGHNVRDGLPGSYAVGKKQGIHGCDTECLKEWQPFVAPPEARAGGFWQILQRPDGRRQWEYKGYALYTYVHDKGPGEVNGNDIYDLVDGEAPARYTAVEAGGSTGAALFWHVATP